MILSRRVALNGIQLDEVDERIVVGVIEEQPGNEAITAAAMAYGDGQQVTDMRRNTLDVVVHFSLWIHKEDAAERALLLEKVNAWAAAAAPGILTVNYRPDRQLRVLLAQAPGGLDIRNWTNDYTITFRAYTVPFWEDALESSVTSGVMTGGSIYFNVAGSARTQADVSIRNRSGMSVSNITLAVAGKQMLFTGIGLGGTATLTIDHADDGKYRYIRARVGSTSVLQKMSGADELFVKPGQNVLTFSASRAVQVTVTTRGRYL